MLVIVVALVLLFAVVGGLILVRPTIVGEKREESGGEWPCAPYEESPEAKEERIRLEVATAIDEYRSGKRKCNDGQCLVCGTSFNYLDPEPKDPIMNRLCRDHIDSGLKHIDYFKDVRTKQEPEQAAA
jgi:hypothetical protein